MLKGASTRVLSLAAAAVMAGAGAAFAAPAPAPQATATPLGRFNLSDSKGHPLHLTDFRGKWVLLYFGYTHCPDACPTDLNELASAIKALGPDGRQVQVVFVTVDPDRDTLATLDSYVPFFDPSFVGARAEAPELAELGRYLGVRYSKTGSGAGYGVDHTLYCYMLNPQGRLQGSFLPPFTAEAVRSHLFGAQATTGAATGSDPAAMCTLSTLGQTGMDPLLGSGTSWHPAASPMSMYYGQLGDWSLMANGRAQFGYNHQHGPRGGDATAAENWGMLMAQRRLGPGQLQLNGMFSLEPLTIPPDGEPQLLQSGETYQYRAIYDRQHPHTFVDEVAAKYTLPLGRDLSVFAYGGPIGEPALGPEAFMHRASSGENPWAPIGHHYEDSTHISHGVLTGGLTLRGLKLEGSVFNGREPGEDRWIPSLGPLDSYSGRLTYNPTAHWSMQVSMGHLTAPEVLAPNDVVRTTASVSYDRSWADGNFAATLLWGRSHELLASPLDFNAYLAESALDFGSINHLYARAEVAEKGLLRPDDAVTRIGYTIQHLPGSGNQTVEAFTLGGVRDLYRTSAYSLGLGADVTVNAVPSVLQASYGGGNPWGFEIYVRIAPPWAGAGR